MEEERIIYNNDETITNLVIPDTDEIYITNCPNLETIVFNTIARLIKVINCPKCTIIDTSRLADVEEMIISKTSITDIVLPPAQEISVSHNKLTSLDIRHDNLTQLYCDDNQLTSLIIPKHIRYASCTYNKIKELFIGSNTFIQCHHNELESIIFEDNKTISSELELRYNKLKSFTVPSGKELTTVHLQNNQLTELLFAENTQTRQKVRVYACNNNLRSLFIPKKTVHLLDVNGNPLESITTDPETTLRWLYAMNCPNLRITEEDISKTIKGFHTDFMYEQKRIPLLQICLCCQAPMREDSRKDENEFHEVGGMGGNWKYYKSLCSKECLEHEKYYTRPKPTSKYTTMGIYNNKEIQEAIWKNNPYVWSSN